MYNTRHIDIQYISLLSNRLDRFKIKKNNPFLANFRCPLCGDSRTSSTKARGYIYERQGSIFFRCHNCGASTTASNFIKTVDGQLWKEYKLDVLKEGGGRPKRPLEELAKVKTTPNPTILYKPFKGFKKVSQLVWDHPVKEYVLSRKIPNFFHSRMYLIPEFKAWTNSLVPGKFEPIKYEEPRLVMPFYDIDGSLIGYQGRSLDPDSETKLRYISIMLDEDRPKIYGLDQVDLEQTIYVTEGAIDSMFLPNALAMLGADVNLTKLGCPKDRFVFIYDNEPRNKDIVKRMQKVVNAGYRLCLWPESWGYNDVNEAVMAGVDTDRIEDVIKTNVVSGLRANMALTTWKRVGDD